MPAFGEPITSPSNPRIKDLVRLRTRRHRDRSGSFLVEGFREIMRAVDADAPVSTLFVCPELFLGSNEEALIARAADAGAEIVHVAAGPFTKASYRDRPEGLLAVVDALATSLDTLRLGTTPLLLVAEAIEKPGNLGTMLRTAAAAGADAVIVCDPTTDPFNPNVVRASIGHLFTMPLAIADTTAALSWLRERNVTIVAATPEADADHYSADLTGATAFIVGSEQHGLSSPWKEAADHLVAIPMAGPVDSLNAATAAAVLLFEAVRQRTSRP